MDCDIRLKGHLVEVFTELNATRSLSRFIVLTSTNNFVLVLSSKLLKNCELISDHLPLDFNILPQDNLFARGLNVRRNDGDEATVGFSITVVWLIELFISWRMIDVPGNRVRLIFEYVINTFKCR